MTLGAKIGTAVVGMLCFICGFALMGMKIPLVAFIPFMLAGFCVAALVGPPIASAFVGYFHPSNVPDAPDEFTAVRARMAEHDFEVAAEELRAIIAADPSQISAKVLLVKVLYDHLQRPEEGLQIAMQELRRAATWTDHHERLVAAATDMALDLGQRDVAIEALERGLALCRRAGPAAQGFAARLDGLRG
jgi:hypothetical protein